MAEITTSENGYVRVEGLSKESPLQAAMLFLVDSLSYLNYAMTGSKAGMGNKEEDLESAHFLLSSAIDSLLYLDEEATRDFEEEKPNTNKQ